MYTVAISYSLTLIALIFASEVAMANAAYDELIRAEQEARSQEKAFEQIVGGSAATAIGLYGYYNDDRGVMVKLSYGAIQTSGIVVLCRAIFALNDSSLLLAVNSEIEKGPNVSSDRLRAAIANVQRQRQASTDLTLGTSASILGTMYLYNGYRSNSDETQLKNIFYFLGANMYLVAGVTWYRILMRQSQKETTSTEVDFRPWPEITYRF